MNRGKATCERLKAIRKSIAEANGIEYTPEECTFEGECNGTCPKYDAELKRLSKLLFEKQGRGDDVVIPPTLIEGLEPNKPVEPAPLVLAGIPVLPSDEDLDFWGNTDELDGDIKPLQGDICRPEEDDDDENYW